MKRTLLAPLLAVAVILTVLYSVKEAVRAIRETAVWESDTTRLFTQLELDRIVRDSAQAFQARADSAAKRLTGIAERQKRSILHLQGVGDSLRGVLDSATNAPDSLYTALGLIETLQATSDSLEQRSAVLGAIIASQQEALVRLRVSDSLGWRNVDSLQAVIRRTPTRCRILGLPCPTLVAGYGVTAQGLGPFAGVAIPLR